MWDLHDIEELNPASPGQSSSQLQHLLSLAICTPSILCETADRLERSDIPRIACFFQSPDPIVLENEWHRLPALEASVTFEIKSALMTLSINNRLAPALTGTDDGTGRSPSSRVITQFVAIIPLWGKRALHYSKYINWIDGGLRGNPTIVSSGDSWIEHRPISAMDFEYNISRRMTRELLPSVRRLLKLYSLHALVPVDRPHWLYGYFTMTAPGRVTYHRPPTTIIERLVNGDPGKTQPTELTNRAITQSFRTLDRALSRFEHQLLAMNRLRLEGELHLALFGVAALIEWFLNSHFNSSRSKQLQLFKLLEMADLAFLGTDLLSRIERIRVLRNLIVHGAPPKREFLTMGYDPAEPNLGHGSKDDRVGDQDVRDAIYTGLNVFRRVNAWRSGLN